MPWAIMDQAVGLPALNGCFTNGVFFVANHLIEIREFDPFGAVDSG